MRLIDANKLMLWLNDVWYSSFKYEESPTSIAVKEAMKAITEYVNTQTDVEPSGDLISRAEAIEAVCEECEWERKCHEECTHIETLKALPSAEAVTHGRLIDADALSEKLCKTTIFVKDGEVFQRMINDAPTVSAEAVQGWIPVKYHKITEDERKENGYPKDWVYFLDCEMPSDDQEILVQARGGTIRWDVCYEDNGYSLDSGWDWKDDIIAWMPLPEPYREDGES